MAIVKKTSKKAFWLVFVLVFIAVTIVAGKIIFDSVYHDVSSGYKPKPIIPNTSGEIKEVSNAEKYGSITSDEIWSGEIHVTGDIIIPEDVTLIIKPGTRVLVKANFDNQGKGAEHIIDEATEVDPSASGEYTQTHSKFDIMGRLMAVGTPEEKIIFTSDAENPKHTDWDGMTFGPTSSGEMKHCIVEWSHTGPALHRTNEVNISHCTIRHTFWGGLHAFQNSPVFEYNVLDDIGHEAFDTHKASPIIRHNSISHARTAVVFNYYNLNTNEPIIFEDNIIRDSSTVAQLQENAKVVIINNKFIGSEDTGGPWEYKGFVLDSQPHSGGIQLADNVDAEIINNEFTNLEGPAISYELIGPNIGIGHTTDTPEPFDIIGAVRIIISNNFFGSIEDKNYFETELSKVQNTKIENNTFGD